MNQRPWRIEQCRRLCPLESGFDEFHVLTHADDVVSFLPASTVKFLTLPVLIFTSEPLLVGTNAVLKNSGLENNFGGVTFLARDIDL